MASEAPPAGGLTLFVSVAGPGRVLSLPPAIDCPGACSAGFAEGTSVMLAAAPMPEGEFTSWSGDCMGASGCFVSMDRESQVTANFGMSTTMMLKR
jgi:hypothetical protein